MKGGHDQLVPGEFCNLVISFIEDVCQRMTQDSMTPNTGIMKYNVCPEKIERHFTIMQTA